MSSDKIKIEVLRDGTIKTTTDPISAANHQNAEAFLKGMARLLGGETIRHRRSDVHHEHDHHDHDHVHEHDGS